MTCKHEMGICNEDAIAFYGQHGFVYCGRCGEKYVPTPTHNINCIV